MDFQPPPNWDESIKVLLSLFSQSGKAGCKTRADSGQQRGNRQRGGRQRGGRHWRGRHWRGRHWRGRHWRRKENCVGRH
ncbi:hypothetical protein DPEC_G00324970 [Dallia pectoralis]|uniref:Uncharacterized protein n=1 Tax=Dallia pectoralis TaxID=75939 RepID=A0ACC2FB46_DALPE|nr:hypothetical protein DPEC_G00324970 [Dallia pectoralis]